MCITARIQLTGIANLCEASAMKEANGRWDDEAAERAVAAGSARGEPDCDQAWKNDLLRRGIGVQD
jgi:hypothetical protein